MDGRERNNSQHSGWDTANNSQSGWNQGNSSQSGWSAGNHLQSGWNQGNSPQNGWNGGNNPQSGWSQGNNSQSGWNQGNSQQPNWNNGNSNSQWNPNMGGGYPGGPGKKNRGGLTKEVVIALLIAAAAIVFVIILFVVSGKKGSSSNENGNNAKSSAQTVAEATTQAATEETQATTAATTQATVATTAATQSQNTTASAPNNEYIFDDSNSRYLTQDEVLSLSRWNAKLAKNEIYARHHRRFDNQDIQQYFDSQQWYSGTIAPSDFREGVLNKYENANIELLKKAEKGTLTSSSSSGTSSTDDGFIFPYSSEVKLTDSEVAGLSKSQLRIARNEIYARHHRKFDSTELQSYFNSQSWYSGTVDSSDFSDDMLNSVEKYNIELIKKYE